MAESHLTILSCLPLAHIKLILSLLIIQQLCSSICCKRAPSRFVFLCSFHSILSFFRRHCDVALFSHHLEWWGSCSFCAYPFNRSVVSSAQVLFALSSLASLFNQSAVQICSSLFLFPNGVFSTSITSVAFFISSCSTFQGSLVSLVCQRSNLVLPLIVLFLFPPVPP